MDDYSAFEDPPTISPNILGLMFFRDTQCLKLKLSDLTVERLARIFKVTTIILQHISKLSDRQPSYVDQYYHLSIKVTKDEPEQRVHCLH
jgi:hypothetical protein